MYRHRHRYRRRYSRGGGGAAAAAAEGQPEVRGRGSPSHLVPIRGGRVLLTEILLPGSARLASNCSTGNCLSNFNQRMSSKSSN